VLRLLVTILMVTMIVGIAVVAGALVYRIASESSPPAMTEITIEKPASCSNLVPRYCCPRQTAHQDTSRRQW